MKRESYDTNGNLFAAEILSAGRTAAEGVPMVFVRAWDRALRMLSQRVNKPTFETHLRGLKPLAMTEEISDRQQLVRRAVIGAPSAFTRSWVEGRHIGVIKEVLEEIFDGAVFVTVGLTPKQLEGTTLRPAPVPALAATDTANAAANAAPGSADVSQTDAYSDTLALDVPAAAPKPAPVKIAATPVPTGKPVNPDAPEINPRYTFDRFIVGPTNRLAHGGALAVAGSPGQRYNPLFLYGPPGLGKTHLLHAIANTQLARPSAQRPRVAYMSGEAFTAQYVTSLRQQKAEEFRRRLKSVDLLLVDDIQFIAGKEQTKEEFFHVFNTLAQSGKQIVICSDRSPRELTAMDERLQSRFESGLVADVAPPELETRLAILQNKAEGETCRVPDDVLLYMARLVQSNIRTLEGALVKLVAYASLTNSQVTTQMAEGILEKYFIASGAGLATDIGTGRSGGGNSAFVPTGAKPFAGVATTTTRPAAATRSGAPDRVPYVPVALRPAPTFAVTAEPTRASIAAPVAPAVFASVAPAVPAPLPQTGGNAGGAGALTPELIQRVVARQFGVAADDLAGKKRDRDVTNARQVAMHLLRELTDMSLPGIGQLFGGRDHTTVIHACDRVKAQLDADDSMKILLAGLVAEMGQTGN